MLSVRKGFILGILLMTALVVAGPGATSTSATPSKKAPKHFEILYCWGSDSIDDVNPLWCPEAEMTLYANGRIDVLDLGVVTSNCGDWWTQKNDRYITFDLDVGVVYTGTRQTDGSYYGTMTAPNGLKGVWIGHFAP